MIAGIDPVWRVTRPSTVTQTFASWNLIGAWLKHLIPSGSSPEGHISHCALWIYCESAKLSANLDSLGSNRSAPVDLPACQSRFSARSSSSLTAAALIEVNTC